MESILPVRRSLISGSVDDSDDRLLEISSAGLNSFSICIRIDHAKRIVSLQTPQMLTLLAHPASHPQAKDLADRYRQCFIL